MIKKIVEKTDMKFLSFYIFLFAFITISSVTVKTYAQTGDTISSEVHSAESEGNHEDSHNGSVVSNGHSQEEIDRGKRFFMGLLPFNRTYESCVSCHNLKQVDTLNWNPSAMDLAIIYTNRDFASFKQALMEPSGIKMEASHIGFNIEDKDLMAIKSYLNDLANTGPAAIKPSYNNLILFLFLGILLTWALIELIFLHKIKRKAIPLIIFVGAFSWQAKMISEDAIRLGRQVDYAPDQPIKFSHKVHVGENGIECMYCHTTADEGKSAGIPPVNLCMNCHVLIREGANSGKFEIAKIVNASETGDPVEWVRIHNLPDHVFFSHEVHVGSAKLDCKQCHGQVQEMDIMRQENDLSMGWCVNCHRDTKVNFKGNGYYEQYLKLHEDLKNGLKDSITAENIGANDCMRCHY